MFVCVSYESYFCVNTFSVKADWTTVILNSTGVEFGFNASTVIFSFKSRNSNQTRTLKSVSSFLSQNQSKVYTNISREQKSKNHKNNINFFSPLE